MLPVIYQFIFDTDGARLGLYVACAFIVAYAAWSGWRGAVGAVDPKTGQAAEATQDERRARAIKYAIGGVGLSLVGMYYSLDAVPFLGIAGKHQGIPIHTYGVLVGGGFIAAATAASWLCGREWPGQLGKERQLQMLDLSFYIFIGAMVGSRVLFIIVNLKDYTAHPEKLFDLGGGLVFYGGLIGASVTAFWYAKSRGIEFLRLADVCMPMVSLGQALGRLGCFAAGCCWGDVAPLGTKLAVHFPGPGAKNIFGGLAGTPSLAFQDQAQDQRWVLESTGQLFHEAVPGAVKMSDWVAEHGHTFGVWPTQLFESAGQLLLFVGLLTLRRYRRFQGQIFGLWLVLYACLRTSVELFRGDAARGTLHSALEYFHLDAMARSVPLEAWYNMSIGQFISLCLFGLGSTVLYRGLKDRQAQPKVDLNALAVG